MKTFTSFRGITPDSLRSRYSDNIFEDQRRRRFGNSTASGDFELSIPGANITQYEEDQRNGYLIELAAPGYDKNDFDINIHEDVLTISGKLADDRLRTHDSFRRQEYNYHTFSRSWALPESTDEDNITANYRNGILEVFVPVLQPAEQTQTPRRISVN